MCDSLNQLNRKVQELQSDLFTTVGPAQCKSNAATANLRWHRQWVSRSKYAVDHRHPSRHKWYLSDKQCETYIPGATASVLVLVMLHRNDTGCSASCLLH